MTAALQHHFLKTGEDGDLAERTLAILIHFGKGRRDRFYTQVALRAEASSGSMISRRDWWQIFDRLQDFGMYFVLSHEARQRTLRVPFKKNSAYNSGIIFAGLYWERGHGGPRFLAPTRIQSARRQNVWGGHENAARNLQRRPNDFGFGGT